MSDLAQRAREFIKTWIPPTFRTPPESQKFINEVCFAADFARAELEAVKQFVNLPRVSTVMRVCNEIADQIRERQR